MDLVGCPPVRLTKEGRPHLVAEERSEPSTCVCTKMHRVRINNGPSYKVMCNSRASCTLQRAGHDVQLWSFLHSAASWSCATLELPALCSELVMCNSGASCTLQRAGHVQLWSFLHSAASWSCATLELPALCSELVMCNSGAECRKLQSCT